MSGTATNSPMSVRGTGWHNKHNKHKSGTVGGQRTVIVPQVVNRLNKQRLLSLVINAAWLTKTKEIFAGLKTFKRLAKRIYGVCVEENNLADVGAKGVPTFS